MTEFIHSLTFADWIGVVGSLMISAAYLAVSAKWLEPELPSFQLLNLAGAVLILISLYYRPNAGAVVIEVFWIAISVWTLIRYLRARRGG